MSEFDERFRALRARFLGRSATDLTILEQALGAGGVDSDDLRQTVHRLAGAAGTFGFAELSRIAGEADDALMVDEAGARPQLLDLIAALRETLTAA